MTPRGIAVRIAGLSVSYRDEAEALRGIDLEVTEGESVCIAGPNGAGKSTLLLCLAGLLRFEGEVTVAGRIVKGSGSADPARFGLVFQNPDDQLFCNTVSEDVAFGPRNMRLTETEVGSRVREALSAVGLAGFEDRAPHRLSIGERKRAALATVLSCRPAVMALDEPWAGLDARASKAVASILDGHPGTKLVVTQDLRHAAHVCGRMVVLDSGRIVADGPAGDLMADRDLMAMHGLDFD